MILAVLVCCTCQTLSNEGCQHNTATQTIIMVNR